MGYRVEGEYNRLSRQVFVFNEVKDNVAGFLNILGVCVFGTEIVKEIACGVLKADSGAICSD